MTVPTCKETLELNNLDNSSKLFCHFKNFKEDNASGGLHMPSHCFLDYILRLEDSFVKNFSVYTKSTTVGGKLLKTLNGIPVTFQHCLTFTVEYTLKLFLTVHIYYTIKFANRNFASKEKSRKYIKVLTHL
jgi:hypothetical protein